MNETIMQHYLRHLFSSAKTRALVIAFVALSADQIAFAQQNNEPYSNDALNQLDEVVADWIQHGQAVGAELLVLHDGKVLLHTAHGDSDREQAQPWKTDTPCNIRSMTKCVTSAAAQILIDRGQLELDKPVGNYIESFSNDKCKDITVRQVLTHRSGLPLTFLFGPRQYKSFVEQVDGYALRGPATPPGETFNYSDAGTDVVGRLVEVVSGESLNVFVEREILAPLNMTQTFYGIDGSEERLANAASLYAGKPNRWNRIWDPDRDPFYPFAWGSQTLYSTTTDYAKFLTMIANGGQAGEHQILSAEAVARMLEPVSPMTVPGGNVAYPTGFHGLKPFYGQMMVTYRTTSVEDPAEIGDLHVFGHSGSDGTGAWVWPDRKLVVLYFTQSRGGGTALRIEEQLDRLLIQPESYDFAVPDHLRPFVGKYVANFKTFEDEEFVVRVRNEKLILDIPSQQAFELRDPDEQGRWAFAIAPDKAQVSFVRDDRQQVIELRLHQGGQEFVAPRKGAALTETAKESKGDQGSQDDGNDSVDADDR